MTDVEKRVIHPKIVVFLDFEGVFFSVNLDRTKGAFGGVSSTFNPKSIQLFNQLLNMKHPVHGRFLDNIDCVLCLDSRFKCDDTLAYLEQAGLQARFHQDWQIESNMKRTEALDFWLFGHYNKETYPIVDYIIVDNEPQYLMSHQLNKAVITGNLNGFDQMNYFELESRVQNILDIQMPVPE